MLLMFILVDWEEEGEIPLNIIILFAGTNKGTECEAVMFLPTSPATSQIQLYNCWDEKDDHPFIPCKGDDELSCNRTGINLFKRRPLNSQSRNMYGFLNV